MFKSLIASALLTASVGAKVPMQVSTLNQDLRGAYCLKSNVGYYNFEIEGIYSVEYEFSQSAYIYVYDNTLGRYERANTFYIEYYDYDSFSITISNPSTLLNGKTYFLYYDDYYTETGDFSSLVIYFCDSVSVPSSVSALFDNFMSQSGNENCSYYNGWFNFHNSIYLPQNVFNVMGVISVDNVLYNYIEFYSGGIYAYYYSSYIEGITYDIYTNNSFKISSRNIHMQTLLPNRVRSQLQSYGSFAYVTQVQETEFQDLFFSIADTPIKFITNMFDFSLLGFNLGVALMSIATLLIVVVVIKKTL